MLNQLFSGISGFGQPDSAEQERQALVKNRNMVLEVITLYLVNFQLGVDFSTEIISNIARSFGVEVEVAARLIDEVENSYCVSNTRSESEKLAKWDGLQHFVASAKFLDNPTDLLSLSLCSRALHKRIMTKLIKRHLIQDSLDPQIRFSAWRSALNVALFETKYTDIISAKLNLSKQLEDLIRMDVHRSFTPNKEFPREELFSVIKAGSLVLDPSIGYCQGMNYLAGLFLINYPPEIAFAMYVRYIELKARPIFTQNFEVLKSFFYVLDNLVDVFIPDLGRTFKTQKVTAVFYASPWFITTFCSALQYAEHSPLVMKVVDLFLVQGYRGVFRAILALLSHFKDQLIDRDFEDILGFLSDLTQKEIFTGSRYPEFAKLRGAGVELSELSKSIPFAKDYELVYSFKARCKEIKLKPEFIQRFEKRYQVVKNRINF